MMNIAEHIFNLEIAVLLLCIAMALISIMYWLK